jgi:hypothetical protein
MPNSHNSLVAISYRVAIPNTLLHVSKITRVTTVLVPIRYRGSILIYLPRVSVICTRHKSLVPISYRTAILSTLIHVNNTHKPQKVNCLSDTNEVHLAHFNVESFIPTSDTRPGDFQLQRRAT